MAANRSPGAIKLNNRGTNELVPNDFDPASGGGIPAPHATLLAAVGGTKLWLKTDDDDPHAYTQVHVTAPA
jgi:hypothetical protein